jgi:hypothetical protein
MEKLNHTCRMCGIKYYACDTCDKNGIFHWRSVACCFEHFQEYIKKIEKSRQLSVENSK